MQTTGVLNLTHHYTAEEWASLVTSPLGKVETQSVIDPKAVESTDYFYLLTDSGLLMFPSKGSSSSLAPAM